EVYYVEASCAPAGAVGHGQGEPVAGGDNAASSILAANPEVGNGQGEPVAGGDNAVASILAANPEGRHEPEPVAGHGDSSTRTLAAKGDGRHDGGAAQNAQGVAAADVPRAVSNAGGSGGAGRTELPPIPGGIGESRMPD